MRVLVWVTEAGWEAAVDAAALIAGAEVTLLHVSGGATEAPGGALSGLLGRRREDVKARLAAIDAETGDRLLDAAAERLGRDAARERRAGRPEREAVEAARGFDVMVVSRPSLEPGPRGLGHTARFVVDHAPCDVLLVWPGEPPSDRPPPPPPGERHGRHPPPPPH